MDEKNFDNPQERQLTPEEQLDLLLEQFKDEPDPETPAADTAEPSAEEAADVPLPEETEAAEAAAMPLTDPLPESEAADLPEEPQAELPALEELPAEEAAEDTESQEETAEMPAIVPVLDIEADASPEAEAAQASAEADEPEEEPAEAAEAEGEESAENEAAPEQPAEEDSAAEATQEAEAAPEDSTEAAEDQPADAEPAAAAEEKSEKKADAESGESEDEEEFDEEEEDEEEEDNEPPKKRRPRNTKAYGFFGIPHILATFIWLGIIVFIGVGLGNLVWNCASDILALGRPDSVVTITITDEDDLDSIADKLKATGLIQYRSLFKLYGQISDAMDSIRTGTFQLNTLFDYHALVDAMSSNQRRVTINVTIPEGYTVQQTFALLEHYGVSTVDALEEAAANGELGEYWFLEGVDRSVDNCLEGYLFPDTYTFYLDHNPVGVLQKFLDNFNKRFNDVMKLKLDTLNVTLSDMMRANGLSEDYIAQHQMTLRDVVIIASMIEKETASNPESYTISSVIYNRLTNPNGETAGYLQLDATLVYINGGKTPSNADKLIDSPYNTYLYKGLPAGPISNPGSYSLDAALDPAQTAYYFYALDPSTGEHHFSKTLKEHEAFLESIRNAEAKEDPEE